MKPNESISWLRYKRQITWKCNNKEGIYQVKELRGDEKAEKIVTISLKFILRGYR